MKIKNLNIKKRIIALFLAGTSLTLAGCKTNNNDPTVPAETTHSVSNCYSHGQLGTAIIGVVEKDNDSSLVSGACVTIKNEKGEVVWDYVSGDEYHYVQLPEGKYNAMIRICPNDDYILPVEGIYFEISPENITTVNLAIEKVKKLITRYKVPNGDIGSMPPIVLEITNQDGKTIESWWSIPYDKTIHALRYIKPGTYLLCLRYSSEEYEVENAVQPFTIDDEKEAYFITFDFKEKRTPYIKSKKIK